MTEPTPQREPIDQLAESFVERFRRGERPSLTEYAEQHPALADQIQRLFPALVMMEDLAPHGEDSLDGTPSASETEQPALETLGDYRILREIGRGGMGVVYEAEQVSLGRRVALKVLTRNSLVDPRRLARFQREARAAASLHHTNIVPVFGVGEQEGIHYFVMQFIHGQALDNVLTELATMRSGERAGNQPPQAPAADAARRLLSDPRAALPAGGAETPSGASDSEVASAPARADSSVTLAMAGSDPHGGSAHSHAGRIYWQSVARVGLQAAEALEYAHGQGVLHRDIKPSNLLLDTRGTLWVADFGLAKVGESGELTHTGDVVGTLRYMAPERFLGRSDARSDIYSLGLTLYELLTLRPAFHEIEHSRLLKQLAERDPQRPRKIDPHVPSDLETIVLKAIAKEPDGRYQAAEAMADDLRRFLEGQPIQARRTSAAERCWLWCRRKPLVAGLTAAIVALVSVGLLATSWAAWHFEGLAVDRQQALTDKQRALDAKNQALQQLTQANRTASERLYEASVAKAHAFRMSRQPGQRLESLAGLREAVALVPELNKGPADVMRLRNAAIAGLALADLAPVRTWEADFPHAFDGKFERYATMLSDGQIGVGWTADDQPLARLAGSGKAPYWIRLNADGSLLAAAYPVREPIASCEIWDVASGQQIQKVEIAWRYAGHSAFDFTPDGRSFVMASSAGVLELYDVERNEPRVRIETGREIRNLALSPDGRQVAVSVSLSFRRAEVQIWDFDSGTKTATCRYLSPVDWIAAIAWTPDGRQLATGVENLIGEITLWDARTGSEVLTLTGHSNSVRRIAFTPDGRYMVSTDWGGWVCLWSLASQQVLLKVKGTFSRLSDDGQLVDISHSAALGRGTVHRLVLPTGFAAFAGGANWIDSDGRLIAFGDARGVQLLDATSFRPLAHLPTRATRLGFFRSRTSSLYVSLEGRIEQWPMQLEEGSTRIRIGPPKVLTRERPQENESLDVSADGRFLALARTNRQEVLVWDLAAGGEPGTLRHPSAKYVALAPDGRITATATWLGRGIGVWDSKTGRRLRELWPESKSANVKFSPDGRWLAAWSGDEYRLWRVDSWELAHRLPRPEGAERLGQFAFSGNGRLLALPMQVGMIRLLALDDKRAVRELATFEDQWLQNEIGLVALSPDGRLLLSPHPDGHEVWNLPEIRQKLAEMGLDWDQPPYDSLSAAEPLVVEVVAAEPATP